MQLAYAAGTTPLGGDCRLTAVLPADGTYTVELHDAAYRAGNPNRFRLALGEADWPAIAGRVAGLAVLLADAAGEVAYDRHDWQTPSALIVGGEAEGESAEGRALAAQRVRIPMQRDSESLNAAVAGSIILFEAARQRRLNIKT